MKSVAFKWRITTTEYAYLTSVDYDKNKPNYTLGGISKILSPEEEAIIAEHVKTMDRDEYHQCFNHISKLLVNYDLNLRNWEYYYNISNEGCVDCEKKETFYSGATANAQLSIDGSVDAKVNLDKNGILNFSFLIPSGINGKDGIDGKDGADGKPGEDGVAAEYIYIASQVNDILFLPDPNLLYGKLDVNQNGLYFNDNDFIPDGWADRPFGIDSIYKYEWVSLRKKDNNGRWGKFSEPKLMSRWGEDGKDGDGIEYIYKITKTNTTPSINTPNDWETNYDYQNNKVYCNFIGDNWTDSPKGISVENKYEWVSIRKQKDGIWQPFSEPQLWSRWGEDGSGVEYIYCTTVINNVPEVPNINEENYQNNEFVSGIWTDEYVEPSIEKKYAWVSIRKKINGIWGKFSEPKLWNIYKINGKTFIDIYTRTDEKISDMSLPNYNGVLYYSFEDDKFYTDKTANNEVVVLTNDDITWYKEIPTNTTSKYLYKSTAQIILSDDLNELVEVSKDMWWGPYLMASNGENANIIAPYVVFDDDSLSVPVKNKTYLPHEKYTYAFNSMLYYNSTEQIIHTYNVKVSDESKIKIINTNPITNSQGDINKIEVSFEIDNTKVFNTIEVVYVTLTGEIENSIFEATAQFKIIPYTSEEAILYKILLNQNNIFIPSNNCGSDNTEPWNILISGNIVDNRGNIIELGDNEELYYIDNSGVTHDFKNGIVVYACDNLTLNNSWVNVNNLPNPLPIIYKVNDKIREVEYINFTNMPQDGIDGKDGENGKDGEDGKPGEKGKDGENGTSSRVIFAYCSVEENVIPDTPIGGDVNFETNEITYPFDPLGVNIWGDINYSSGVVWVSQCEFISNKTTDLVWSKPMRLTGFKGENSIHVELSNDVDQVYVINGEVKTKQQTIETIVTLMDGGKKCILSPENITVENDYFTTQSIKIDDYNVKVICELIANTLTDIKNIDIIINVNVNDENHNNIQLSKIFKALVLNGTIDFDLNVSPTFIKRDKNDALSNNEIKINVTKREIALNTKTVDNIDNLSEFNLITTYYFNDDIDNINILNSNILNLTNEDVNKITISLYKEDVEIDRAIVDIIYDGKDGVDGKPGENGKDGKDGISIQYIYLLTESDNYGNSFQPSEWLKMDNYQDDNFVPPLFDWSPIPLGVSETKKYEWVSERKTDRNSGEWGVFSKPTIWAKWGEKGEDGKSGKLIYPAGAWSANTTYSATTTTAPFVSYGTPVKYYVLQVDKSETNTTPDKNTTDWLEMSKYEAIYADIIVADNALIGGSVYNRDYVFSKKGLNKNLEETPKYNNFYGGNVTLTDDKGYILESGVAIPDLIFKGYFDDNLESGQPFYKLLEEHDFIPNYLLDFNKGRAWFGGGKTVINEKGTIFSKDIVDIIHEIATPYPSGSTNNGWDEVVTGYTSEELNIEREDTIYIKKIKNLNVFVHDNYQLTGNTCPKGLIFLNVSLPDDLLPMKDIWYKGSILLGNTCAASKIIRFPSYNVKYKFTIYDGRTTINGNKFGLHIGSGGILNYIYKPSEKAIEIIGDDSTCYSDISKIITIA